MVRPQSEDLNRSGNTPLDPDSIGGRLDARDQPEADDRTGGPVPPENRPGHHPETAQDQPDTDAFVARFTGRDERDEDDDATHSSLAERVKDRAVTVGRTTSAVIASARRVARATVAAIREEISDRSDGDDEADAH